MLQFFGSGKFKEVGFIRCKGIKNLKKLRAWKVEDDVYVGVLSPGIQKLKIFKAVKTGEIFLVSLLLPIASFLFLKLHFIGHLTVHQN